ncbi:hypothetical protein [Sphingobacterium sp.]|uniref:hypothetical protein n=1 Tax=Sphingobacterium sp. TaxID=341027 RepID=UPI00259096AC|nr:hypothetical protein [Sphingobacterium sp.]WET69065.1 MAG: hypothetical protein P0Y57_24795 [Sphingobacterium sp.]
MKLKITFSAITLLLISSWAHSQTTQFRYRVFIQKKHKVIEETKKEGADTVRLPAGAIVSYQKKFKLKGIEYTADIKDSIKSDTELYLAKDVPEVTMCPGSATVAVDKKDKSKLHINYWLADKYDRDGKYYIKLKNREYVSFWHQSIEGGPLTIPFKYRPKFEKNGKNISDEFTADLNIGAYLGYSIGKIKYMYRRNEEKEPSKWLVSVGPFLSVSKVEIDSTSTVSALEPLKIKKNIATVSPGIGVMTSIYNFRLGVFLGKDIAIGETARKWDYHNKWWWGFGFGYNVGLLWGAAK